MKCPYCQVNIHPNVSTQYVGEDEGLQWATVTQNCPACKRLIVELASGKFTNVVGTWYLQNQAERYFAKPKAAVYAPPAAAVPATYADDYIEAAAIIGDSPKASAALSRRCLQAILHDIAGIKKANLAQEIDAVLASHTLPAHLAESIDAIRNIGNFASHPIKSTATGQIVPVEPGEAEWTLDVLEGLFDFYFVQPELTKKRKAALDAKLAAAGKPPVK